MILASPQHPTTHRLAEALRDKAVLIALGAYTAAIGAGWIALGASFM